VHARPWSVLAAFILLLAFATPAHAEDPRADMPLAQLELQQRPLRRAEAEASAAAWMALLQQAVQDGTDTTLALEAAKEGAREPLLEKLREITDRRAAITERTNVVLADLEAKGGDVTEYRQYVAAIGDARDDLVARSSWVDIAKRWLTAPEGGIRLAKSLGFFLLLLFGFRIVANIAGNVVARALGKVGNTPQLLRNFLANMARNIIFFIGIVVALSQLGVDIGPMLAAIGGAGFVIGFALQSTLSNFAAGVMILLYRPYELGDVVTVAGTTGKVKAMTLVSTTIMTPDNQIIVVPNSNIWGDVITNVTGSATRRVDLVFGIGYNDDMDKAQALLEELATSHPKVLETPETVVKVGTLNASSVDYIVRPWCKTEDYWDVYWDLTRTVKERFDAEGISIPFPQTDIHVHQVTPA